MRFFNLRTEERGDSTFLIADIESSFTNVKSLWFSVPAEFTDWITADVYDAFLVAAMYPAMYYGEDVQIDGYVSSSLYFNCTKYVPSIIKAYRPLMKDINISVLGFKDAEQVSSNVGTGFSAGVDSFVTLYDRYAFEFNHDYKVNALFFFNLGSHGGGGAKAEKKFEDRFSYLSPYPKEMGLPYIKLNSNLFDIYRYEWEFDAGIFCRATGILIFQRKLSKYYVSSDNSYYEHMRFIFDLSRTDLSSIIEHSLHPLLSTNKLSIITDGGQYRRSEKTEKIVDWSPVQKYLNVCVNSYDSVKNCTMCHKCLRTCFTIDVLGKLDLYKDIFDLKIWEQKKDRYKCLLVYNYNKDIYAKDNVDFARIRGYRMPSTFYSYLRLSPYIIMTKLKLFVKNIIGENSYKKLWNFRHAGK